MKVKGLGKAIKELRKMRDGEVNDRIDELDGDEEIYERLNNVWDDLNEAIELLEGIKEL